MKIKYLAIILLAIPLTACDKTYADSYDEGFSDGYEAAQEESVRYVTEKFSLPEVYSDDVIRDYVFDSQLLTLDDIITYSENYSIDELYEPDYIRDYVINNFYIDDLYDTSDLVDYLESKGYTVTLEQNKAVVITYIGNKNSKIFHKSSCPSVLSMKDKNKEESESRDYFVEKGYKPCDNCNP